MYHELTHDVLNKEDLNDSPENKGNLMYPSINLYEGIAMDEFINSYQNAFQEYSNQ
jgi:hypothetical protein